MKQEDRTAIGLRMEQIKSVGRNQQADKDSDGGTDDGVTVADRAES